MVIQISVLAGLTNLTFLHLEGRKISDISPLLGLTSLERLDLFGMPLDAGQMAELREALSDTCVHHLL